MTTYAFNASFLTEIAVLIMWAILPPYAYLTFKQSGHSTRKAAGIGFAMLAWGAWAFGAVKYHLDDVLFSWLPNVALKVPVYLFLIAGITLLLRRWLLGQGLSQRWLLGLQTMRVIGLLFIVEYARGNVPAVFALPAGLGDFTTAIIAIIVLVRYRNQPIPRAAILLVFTVGMVDFASAIFFGVTSSNVPFQLFAFDNPNQVALYPTGLIPLYGVPFALMFHILSMLELRRASVKVTTTPIVQPVG